MKQAVILAGGTGKRLMPITKNIPKPMVKITDNPFLDYLIYQLRSNGITEILLLTGYKSLIIKKYYQNKKDIKIKYADPKWDTGARLLKVYKELEDNFFLLYGDIYCNISFKKLIFLHFKNNQLITPSPFLNPNGEGEYGIMNNVKISSKNEILKYLYNTKRSYFQATDIGYFLIQKKIIKNLSNYFNPSFQRDLFLNIIKNNKTFCNITKRKYYYITKKEDIKIFKNYVKRTKRKII